MRLKKYGIVFLYLRISDQKWQAMVSCNGEFHYSRYPDSYWERVFV